MPNENHGLTPVAKIVSPPAAKMANLQTRAKSPRLHTCLETLIHDLLYVNGSTAFLQLDSSGCRHETASRGFAAALASARAPLPRPGGRQRSWIPCLSCAHGERIVSYRVPRRGKLPI